MAKDCPQDLQELGLHKPASLTVRLIEPKDNLAIAEVIRRVSAEHSLSADAGFSVADATLDHLSEQYTHPHAAYWVIEKDGSILGGGGVAPLPGHDGVCELQKNVLSTGITGQRHRKAISYPGDGDGAGMGLSTLLPRDHRQPHRGHCLVSITWLYPVCAHGQHWSRQL